MFGRLVTAGTRAGKLVRSGAAGNPPAWLRWHQSGTRVTLTDANSITVNFIERNGDRRPVRAEIGKSLMEAAHANGVDLEGACEGSLACSTCHVYLDQKTYDAVEEPNDDENDMLDLAFGLSELSRLGCQVIAERNIDGVEATLPPATRNMAVDGYVAKPH